MPIEEIKGDIFRYPTATYICQQTNCVAMKPHGFSYAIKKTFDICPYSSRKGQG